MTTSPNVLNTGIALIVSSEWISAATPDGIHIEEIVMIGDNLLTGCPLGESMADHPLEYELMMTSYTQLGQEFSDDVDHLDAFVPSGVEENQLGFDLQIPYLKGIAFQFKRPKNDSPRRFSVRYSNQDPPRQLDRMRNWELMFGPRAAFYALPLVVSHDDLSKTLRRTVYVPASVIDTRASVIRIPEGYVEDGELRSSSPIEVYCSRPSDTSDNHTTTIAAADVFGWKGLKKAIWGCLAGFRMRWNGESVFEDYDDEYYWYPRPDDNLDEDPLEVSTRAERFVEARAPILTRIGAQHPFA